MKSYFIALVMCAFAVAACQKFSQQDISSSTDSGLCSVFWDSSFNRSINYDEPTNNLINAEVAKRKLDCDPDNHTCLGYGHKHGSKGYTDCRMKLRVMAEENRQLGVLMQGLKDVKATIATSDVTIHNRPWPY